MKEQVGAFHRAKEELGSAGKDLRLALSRVCVLAKNDADARRKLELAYHYYNRFENVFTGPGQVSHGRIADLPQKQTIEQLGRNLIICPAAEMIDRLGVYADLGIDDFIMNVNIGHGAEEALECIQGFGEQVLPHFAKRRNLQVA